MTNETAATGAQRPGPGNWAAGAHPAGEIRLATGAALGRRARLLAAMADTAMDPYCTVTSPYPTCSVTGPA